MIVISQGSAKVSQAELVRDADVIVVSGNMKRSESAEHSWDWDCLAAGISECPGRCPA